MFKFFDSRSHPEKKEVKVGILKVVAYESFPDTFIKFMSAETAEEQVFWWEILKDSLKVDQERMSAEILYFSYYEVAYHLQNEYIENDSSLASRVDLHKAVIMQDTNSISSHDYIVVLAALVHLQELLDIEFV
ncbi:MAG: hypothetical protein RBS56_04335 [Candidatus Gracilibacteria bacterium]|jgi:hypothetical protein|nr:hypothetical protein [Candidatus Gracilibacteria bacterium]